MVGKPEDSDQETGDGNWYIIFYHIKVNPDNDADGNREVAGEKIHDTVQKLPCSRWIGAWILFDLNLITICKTDRRMIISPES